LAGLLTLRRIDATPDTIALSFLLAIISPCSQLTYK
jgi:hypothetical protein